MGVNTLIQFRKGSDWTSNPILASGEPGFDINKNMLKVGDGITNWSGLIPVNYNLNNYDIFGTGNIDISGNITANTGNLDVLSFNVNNESVLTKGQITWDDTEGTMDIGLTDNTTIHVGSHRYFRIRNSTGGILYKGQAVYATGVHSNGIIEPAKYVADGTVREVYFMGLMLEDVSNNSNGYAIDFGHLEELDLDGSASNYAVGDETWSAGDILYVHPTVAGKLTKVEPKHSISLAIVLDPGNGNGNGRMFVRPTSYGHLSDNHDVDVSGLLNNQFLVYDSGTDYWQPSSGLYYVDGDLGIGTASPSYKLDVNGTFSANSINVNDQFTFPTTDGAADQYLKTDGSGNLSWSSVDGSSVSSFREYEEATTNKTIFTTSATYDSGNLDVYYNGLKLLINEDYIASGGTTFELVENAVSGDIIEWVAGYTGSSFFQNVFGSGVSNYITKWVDKNTITSGIVYDDGTNVGIGTASPSYKLEVNGDIGLTDSGFYASPTGVSMGVDSWIYQSGQQVLSNGSFSTDGDAQFSQNILKAQTTDNTLTHLSIGSSSGVLLASNRTYNFVVNIVGRRTNGQDNAGYKIEGLLFNDGYGAEILGTPVKTTYYESDTSWDAQVSVTGAGSGGTDYLLVGCQGATSKNINWVAHVDMLEVGGNIDGYTEVNMLNINSELIP